MAKTIPCLKYSGVEEQIAPYKTQTGAIKGEVMTTRKREDVKTAASCLCTHVKERGEFYLIKLIDDTVNG